MLHNERDRLNACNPLSIIILLNKLAHASIGYQAFPKKRRARFFITLGYKCRQMDEKPSSFTPNELHRSLHCL